MAYSYPMWIEVQACIYKSDKSYGAMDTNHEIVHVGTSAKNSMEFIRRGVRRKALEDGTIQFRAYHNGICLEELIYDPKKKTTVSHRSAEIKGLT